MVCTCCFGLYIRYKTLVNNVYPAHPGEEGARASNLSLLVTYAQSKPERLSPIGDCLERRLRKDIKHGRLGYIRVTFAIVMALMEACYQHINLLAPSILRMVQQVLALQGNLDAMVAATTAFVVFVGVYMPTSAHAERATNALFVDVVHQYCRLAACETGTPLERRKMRLSGLRALLALVATDSFLLNHRAEKYLEAIYPSALRSVEEQFNTPGGAPPPPDGARAPSGFSIQDDLITDRELAHLAERIVHEVASRANAATLRVILDPLLQYLDAKDKWAQTAFAEHCFAIVAQFLPSAYHSTLLSYVLARLNIFSTRASPMTSADEQTQRTLVLVLTDILKASGPAALGFSVLELLDCLVTQLHCASRLPASPLRDEFHAALVSCIGTLAAHVMYPSQINEILLFLLARIETEGRTRLHHAATLPDDRPFSKLAPAHATDSSETSDTRAFRLLLAQSLLEVVEVRYRQVLARPPGAWVNSGANTEDVPVERRPASRTSKSSLESRESRDSRPHPLALVQLPPPAASADTPALPFPVDQLAAHAALFSTAYTPLAVAFLQFVAKLFLLEAASQPPLKMERVRPFVLARSPSSLPEGPLPTASALLDALHRHLLVALLRPAAPAVLVAAGCVFSGLLRRFRFMELVYFYPVARVVQEAAAKQPSPHSGPALTVVGQVLLEATALLPIETLHQHVKHAYRQLVQLPLWEPELDWMRAAGDDAASVALDASVAAREDLLRGLVGRDFAGLSAGISRNAAATPSDPLHLAAAAHLCASCRDIAAVLGEPDSVADALAPAFELSNDPASWLLAPLVVPLPADANGHSPAISGLPASPPGNLAVPRRRVNAGSVRTGGAPYVVSAPDDVPVVRLESLRDALLYDASV